jgi:ribonuclease J
MKLHAELAMELGIPNENIAVVENGTMLTLTSDSFEVGERVPGGYVYVDGLRVGDVGPAVMRDREMLGQNGFVIVITTLSRDTRQIIGEPEVISRGFVYVREAQELIDSTYEIIKEVVYENERASTREIRSILQRRLERFFYGETKRRPMVFTFVNEV